jgi:hypothetical protein
LSLIEFNPRNWQWNTVPRGICWLTCSPSLSRVVSSVVFAVLSWTFHRDLSHPWATGVCWGNNIGRGTDVHNKTWRGMKLYVE